ncbi:MAG: tRNA epoxyqueuosine(34) reductase QueG [Terrisporobacter sp.]|uniref:tRNA epoxyqueuosine(34) reductase QueG n=1 Tax=Terrisporobacter sp. TaxID=1965305 RepID=UPI002FC96268
MNKEKLIDIFEKNGIDTVGIAPAGPYTELVEILKGKIDKKHTTGMEEPNLDRRINPKLIMEDAKSVIVCTFPYYIGNIEDANISKYCYGKDYHIVIDEMLNKICEEIKYDIEGFDYKIFADNGPLVDRYLAYLSGIGYFGINNNIITDKYGSYVFIGYIINNYEFKCDEPLDKTCNKCNKCVEYCPGNALKGNYEMNPQKCLSFLTQKKEELSLCEEVKIKDNKMLFGCDICQDVCPHNKNIEKTKLKSFTENLITKLDKEEISEISNKEFKRRYKDRAFSWRGRKIIKRNMDIMGEESVKK